MNCSDTYRISLCTSAIDTQSALARANLRDCGAVLMFLGQTRESTGSIQTNFLEYEAYEEMAVAELKRLVEAALEEFPVRWIEVVHRLGRVGVGEASILVIVASPHRKAAFEVGRRLMDRIKEDVPIWKRDEAPGGSQTWIHPAREMPEATS
jgi:molybdopterin synthase catalytic subunit